MNKFLYIVLALLTMSFTACEVEDGDYGNRPTIQGRIAFETAQAYIYDDVAILDLISKVDFYAQAPEDKKEGIKNYYLKEYQISKTNQAWILKSAGSEITFTHNSKSINETGAIWTAHITFIEGQYKQVIVDDDNFRLESNGDKKWSIKITDMIRNYVYYTDKNETNTGEFTITGNIASDKSPNLYDFKIESGTGKIKASPTLNYEVKEPLLYFYVSDYFSSPVLAQGVLAIRADNKDDITASISVSGSSPVYQITFNGITEDWGFFY